MPNTQPANPMHLHPNSAWERVGSSRLTVILPCYNYADFLADAVASVVEQRVEGVELIILNDGSTDASLEQALKLMDLFPDFPILVIDQENQGQPAISRNNAIFHARGTFILPLDADDLLAEGAIAALLMAQSGSKNAWTVTYGSMEVFGTESGAWQTVPFQPDAMLRRNQIPYCAMYPRSLWQENGGYSTNVPGYEDWDFWVGAVSLGAKFVHVPVVHLYYRETRTESMMDRGLAKHEWNVAGIISNHPHGFEDEEVLWARHFRALFTNPPEHRGFYGLDALYPHAAALLIGFYPNYYSREKVAWLEEYFSSQPFALTRGVLAPKREQVPEPPPVNGQPVYAFLEAQAEFHEDRFDEAEDWVQRYREVIDYDSFSRFDNRDLESEPTVSVVIVAWKTNRDLLFCLDSLREQSDTDFEIIVVDNGGNCAVHAELAKRDLLHLVLPANVVLSEGRNIGAHFARGKILAMLDDDALVPSDYIASIKRAFEVYDILALRGRIQPKTTNPNNLRAEHYDFGPVPVPSPIDTEGNSAWRADIWQEMKGMNPLLFGHEGSELAYRITRKYGEERVIYWPGTLIFHDYAASDSKLGEKSKRHERMKAFLKRLHPDAEAYIARMRQPLFLPGGPEAAERLIPRKQGVERLAFHENPAFMKRGSGSPEDTSQAVKQSQLTGS